MKPVLSDRSAVDLRAEAQYLDAITAVETSTSLLARYRRFQQELHSLFEEHPNLRLPWKNSAISSTQKSIDDQGQYVESCKASLEAARTRLLDLQDPD